MAIYQEGDNFFKQAVATYCMVQKSFRNLSFFIFWRLIELDTSNLSQRLLELHARGHFIKFFKRVVLKDQVMECD